MNAGLGARSRPIYLCTGGVIINGGSSWRTDQLAYGGGKFPASAARVPVTPSGP